MNYLFTLLYFMCLTLLVTATVKESPRDYHSSWLRSKRQACQDGTYQIDGDGKTCCLCAAGQRWVNHCSVNPEDTTCASCEEGKTYNSVANSQDSCEPCQICDSRAGLVVGEACTVLRDTICRCQQGHYCDKGRDCKSCYSCQTCGEEGIKTECTATNNTLCNDKQEHGGGHSALYTLLLIIPIFVIAILLLWRKKRLCFAQTPSSGLAGGDVELTDEQKMPLKGVDLMPHVPDISKTLGWRDMREVAMRSGMTVTDIENHQLNFPHSAEDQCQSLLTSWVQKEAMQAAEKLVQILGQMEKKHKAEKVMRILSVK